MKYFKRAFPLTIPVMAAYLFLGVTYGLLAQSMGYIFELDLLADWRSDWIYARMPVECGCSKVGICSDGDVYIYFCGATDAGKEPDSCVARNCSACDLPRFAR